jgi:hypothetical protein
MYTVHLDPEDYHEDFYRLEDSMHVDQEREGSKRGN